MMRMSRTLVTSLAAFAIGLTGIATATASTSTPREDNPWREAPAAVKSKVLKQLRLPGPAKCYFVYVFDSAPSFGAIGQNTELPWSVARQCEFSDSNFFIQKQGGRWVRLSGLDGSSWECPGWHAALAAENLPPAVEEYLKPNCYGG